MDVVYPSSTNVGRTREYKLETSSKEPPSVGWSVVVGIAEGSPDLGELDFVGKKLVFLVEVAVAVLPQIPSNTDEFEKHLYRPTSTRPFGTDRRSSRRNHPV